MHFKLEEVDTSENSITQTVCPECFSFDLKFYRIPPKNGDGEKILCACQNDYCKFQFILGE